MLGFCESGQSCPPFGWSDAVQSVAGRDYATQLQQYGPVVAQLTAAVVDPDPRVRKAKLEARLVNLKRMQLSAPGVLQGWIRSQITVTEAKLGAFREKAAEERETVQSHRQWAALGKTSVGTGILVGGALAVLILVTALRR